MIADLLLFITAWIAGVYLLRAIGYGSWRR